MPPEQFDAYGEAVPGAPNPAAATVPGARGRVLGRIGQAAFWLLVVTVVLIRAACFSTGLTVGFPDARGAPQTTSR
ncbi:MAG: hypothetical protein WBA29_07380 [Xanthobacteraceae bacterium]